VPLNDADLVARVLVDDDHHAFAELVRNHQSPVRGLLRQLTRSDLALADDLAQETFLRAYKNIRSFRGEAKFSTWLYRIATNLAVNHARDTRHERAENVVSLDEKDEDTGQSLDLPDKSQTAEEMIVQRERMSAIRQRVQELPERQRIAVLMHKYQQMDYKQISEVLKLSESATKSLLFRAYETLRGQLKEFV